MLRSVQSVESGNVFFRCVEEANEAIMLTDTLGILVYVNPAWCRVYEYTKEEAIGQRPTLLNSGLHDGQFYALMWRSIIEKNLWKGTVVNKTKSGRYIPVSLSITPFRNEDESVAGYMGIATDISEIRQMQTKLLQQERLASIGLLASGIAHEIGTPLGVIRGRAEMLMAEVAANSHSAQWLSTIIKQIDRISTLLKSLLNLARHQQSNRPPEWVPLESVIREILILTEQRLSKFNVSIKLNLNDGMRLYAQPEKLQQILLNLIVNAIFAIEQAVGEGRVDGHKLEIKAVEEDSSLLLSISDSGCGIPAENLPKLFQPFFTTRKNGEGTGLGLPIVKELLEEMGAGISLKSSVNEGTCFTLRFPSLQRQEIYGKESAG